MPFTYSANLAQPRDKVRLLIGDTDEADPQLSDEEVDLLLTDEPDTYLGAASCAEAIAARYARQSDYMIKSDLSESISQLQAHYTALAQRLRRRAARRGVAPYAGGISQADKEAQREDPDRVVPVFSVEMEAEPGTEIPTELLETETRPI